MCGCDLAQNGWILQRKIVTGCIQVVYKVVTCFPSDASDVTCQLWESHEVSSFWVRFSHYYMRNNASGESLLIIPLAPRKIWHQEIPKCLPDMYPSGYMHQSERGRQWFKLVEFGTWGTLQILLCIFFPSTSRNTRALLTPDGLTVIIQSNGAAPSYCCNHITVSFDPDRCGGQLIAIRSHTHKSFFDVDTGHL